MLRTRQTVIVLLATLVSASLAEAAPIVYFDSYRSLNVNGTVWETTAQGTFSANDPSSGRIREHRSTIGASLVDAQGHPFEEIFAVLNLNSFTADGPSDISSDLFTRFLLDSSYMADLDVSMSARDHGSVQGFLFNETTQTMLAQVMLNEGSRRMQFEGVLDPGIYSYFLFADIANNGGTHQSGALIVGEFELQQFTPVPEPATMTLFGAGLAAAAWRRRKQGTDLR